MPLPNSDIVSAFFESYITIRKGIWNLDVNDNDSIKIPDSAKPVHKITTCSEMLVQFKNAVTFEDWLAIVDDLYDKERAEKQTQEERYLITRLLTNSPLLLEVLRAARTYIISEIKTEIKFKNLKQKLTTDKELLEKEILWQKEKGKPQKDIDDNQKQLDIITNKLNGRDDTTDYYISFFTDTISKCDHEAKKLDEKSFSDFKKNVLNKSRPLTLCKLFVESREKKANSNHLHSKTDQHTQTSAVVKEENKPAHPAEKQTTPPPSVTPAPVAALVPTVTTPVPTQVPVPATAPAPVAATAPAPAKTERKAEKVRETSKTAAKEEAPVSTLVANSTFTHRRPTTYTAVVKNHAQAETDNDRYDKSYQRNNR